MPDIVAGARPAVVERIKIHGPALEGNLEGDAVDRVVTRRFSSVVGFTLQRSALAREG